MQVTFAERPINFRPWRPQSGQVFTGAYAFDSETTLIDDTRPWLTPAYVLGAVSDGQQGYFLCREHVAGFFAAHRRLPVVMHHAAFDLDVIHVVEPSLDIYSLVDDHLVWDTRLLHCLLMLGAEGHTARGKGRSTLEHCAEYYLGEALPKDALDSQGREVRKSYGQWIGRPPHEIKPVYLEYLAKDVMATWFVFQKQRELLRQLLNDSRGVWGYVSPQWLAERVSRWGWQTHHIQVKAAIVLRAVTANGFGVDVDRRDDLIGQLDEVLDELRESLRRHGYLPGQPGSGKALQEIFRRLECQHSDDTFPRTATDKYATSREALAEMADVEPFVRDLLCFNETEKLKSSFLSKMARRRLHPSFDPVMVSGRTSSFGEINAQNLPRDDRVRSCFIPTEGNIFIDADYSTVELATLAQAVQSQFGLSSRMGDAINAGRDLHRVLAAFVTGKQESEVTSEERRMAKPVNFGLPGGMGITGLRRYAKASYGVELNDEQATQLSDSWRNLFPEMRAFLSDGDSLGHKVAENFDLTPVNYYEHTGRRCFLDHPDNVGLEEFPHPILGSMCLKVLKTPRPERGDGRPYAASELDFFWSHVEKEIDVIDSTAHAAIRQRQASLLVQRAVMRAVDRASVFTLSGRLRANASYCARHNTVFQGLAADGAKLALWKLWRAGYRIVNFVHDEVLIEVPEHEDLGQHAERIRQLMIDGMQEVVPDIRIDVEYSASRRWYKNAGEKRNETGQLVPWEPLHSIDEVGTGSDRRRSQLERASE